MREVAKKVQKWMLFEDAVYWIPLNLVVNKNINCYDALKVLLNLDYICS